MKANDIRYWRLLVLAALLAALAWACGGGQGQDLLPTADATSSATLPPTAPAELGQDLLPTAPRTPPATTASRPTATTPAVATPIAYIPGDDPCVEPVPSLGGGAGQDFLDIAAGEAVLARLQGHSRRPYYAAFSPDGQTVVTADLEEVRLWRADTGRLLHAFRSDNLILSPSFNPNGELLAASMRGWQIRLWSVATGRTVRDLTIAVGEEAANTNSIASPARFSPGGQQIAAAVGRTIHLLNAETGATVRELAGEVFGEENGEVFIGNGHAGSVTTMAYSASGQVLLSGGAEGTVRLWDVSTGEHLRCFDPGGYVDEVAISPDGTTVAANLGSLLYFWDAVDGRLRDRWEAPALGDMAAFAEYGLWTTSRFNSLHYRGDGEAILVGMDDQTARIYDTASSALTGLMRHPRPVNWAEFSPDGNRIIAAIGAFNDTSADPVYEAWIWDASHPEVSLAAAAQNLVEEGIVQGLNGDVAGALDNFQRAQALNPYAEHDLEQEGQARMALALVDQAAERAGDGDYAQALALIARAQSANPNPEYNIQSAAENRVINALYGASSERARAGDLDGASAALAGVRQINPDAEIRATALNDLCRYGSLWHQAADVLPICDVAVERAPFDFYRADFRDSRGIARALSGDYAGAIDDFNAYVAFYEERGTKADEVAQRQEWIAALRADRNPFDRATLEALRRQGEQDG